MIRQRRKWKTFLLSSDWSKDEILFENHVPKPSFLRVRELHNACGVARSRVEKGTINAKNYIHVLEQYFGNSKTKTVSITIAWLRRKKEVWLRSRKQINKQTKNWQTIKWKMLYPTRMGEFFSVTDPCYNRERGGDTQWHCFNIFEIGCKKANTVFPMAFFWDFQTLYFTHEYFVLWLCNICDSLNRNENPKPPPVELDAS